jgi:hypothetical protein
MHLQAQSTRGSALAGPGGQTGHQSFWLGALEHTMLHSISPVSTDDSNPSERLVVWFLLFVLGRHCADRSASCAQALFQ